MVLRIQLVGLLLSAAVVFQSVEARAETEAETAARTERQLTDTEIERLVRDCVLPTKGTPLSGAPADLMAVRVELPRLKFLPTVEVRRNQTDPTKADVAAFPDLPKGGIGRRDYCDSVILTRVRPPEAPMLTFLAALRLRPGLDTEADYPSAFAELVRREQYLEVGAASYAAIPVAKDVDIEEVYARIAGNPAIGSDGFYFEINYVLYVPLLE